MAEITDTPSPTLKRLDDQIAWYDEKSSLNQRRFKALMSSEITTWSTTTQQKDQQPTTTS